jgi:hypothetical protein
MTTGKTEWEKSQQSRLVDERDLLTAVGIGLAFFDGTSNWPAVALCIFLLLIVRIRSRAVTGLSKESAQERLSVTNPILVFGSLLVIYYMVTLAVERINYSSTLIGDVAVFSALCILLGLGILLVEHYSNSEYFDWMSERALDRARSTEKEFWVWIAGAFKRFSPTELTDDELDAAKKQKRARQRQTDTPFTPQRSADDPPSFTWRYCFTVLREIVQWKRSLSLVVGILFLRLQSVPLWMSVLGSALIWVGASILADHVKYWYFFRPVRDGVFQELGSDTPTRRIMNQLQSYWMSNLLSICVLWTVW